MCYITPKEFTCCFVQSNSSQNASYASNVTFMRLSILDAPQAALTGTALEKQKEVVKTGKAALDKLMNEAKKVLVKGSDKEDGSVQRLVPLIRFKSFSHTIARFLNCWHHIC